MHIRDAWRGVRRIHIKDNTFVCVSTIDIRGYISQFKDTVGFSEIKEKYPLKVTVKYENDAL